MAAAAHDSPTRSMAAAYPLATEGRLAQIKTALLPRPITTEERRVNGPEFDESVDGNGASEESRENPAKAECSADPPGKNLRARADEDSIGGGAVVEYGATGIAGVCGGMMIEDNASDATSPKLPDVPIDFAYLETMPSGSYMYDHHDQSDSLRRRARAC